MKQPKGFEDPVHPDFVCHLKKAIYGLKQAPRAWFERFGGFLTQHGLIRSVCDTSMFIYQSGSRMLLLLLYVDDIILTGSSLELLQSFIALLSKEFSMKDLGDLYFFLGIEYTRTADTLLLSQKKYALTLLQKADMLLCGPATTPVTSGPRVSFHHGIVLDDTDVIFYRRLVGGLQYLTLTLPDLCFAVNYVCQFMHIPTFVHLQLVKRILHYVKGTVSSGVTLSAGPCDVLHAYSDSDWEGCPDTRKSTAGYCIFFWEFLGLMEFKEATYHF